MLNRNRFTDLEYDSTDPDSLFDQPSDDEDFEPGFFDSDPEPDFEPEPRTKIEALVVVPKKKIPATDQVEKLLQSALSEIEVQIQEHEQALEDLRNRQEKVQQALGKPQTQKAKTKKKTKTGKFFDDVAGTLSTTEKRIPEIMDALAELGYVNNKTLRQRLSNALSQWTKAGKLVRVSRGVYALAK